MARGSGTGRQLAHAGVVLTVQAAHRKIDENPDLTDGQRFLAHLAVAALQVGGHVAVEKIAEWVDQS